MKDSDIFLVVTDMFSTPIPNDEIFQRLSQSHRPILVAVNKIDLEGRAQQPMETAQHKKSEDQSDEEEKEEIEKTYSVAEAVAKWRALLPNALAIIPMVASSESQSNQGASNQGASESASEEHPGVSLLRQILVGSVDYQSEDIPALVRALGRPIPGMFRDGIKTLRNEENNKVWVLLGGWAP